MISFFFQSVVLVSRLPFVALFNELVSIIAPGYFDNGEPSLEAGNLFKLFQNLYFLSVGIVIIWMIYKILEDFALVILISSL